MARNYRNSGRDKQYQRYIGKFKNGHIHSTKSPFYQVINRIFLWKGNAKEKTWNGFRWAQELEKNCSLICQIEILSRGVLSKDTQKAVEKLAQYFYYYASFSNDDENILKGKFTLNLKTYH